MWVFESFIIKVNIIAICHRSQTQYSQLCVLLDYKNVKLCAEKYSKKYIKVVVDELECGSWLISFPRF